MLRIFIIFVIALATLSSVASAREEGYESTIVPDDSTLGAVITAESYDPNCLCSKASLLELPGEIPDYVDCVERCQSDRTFLSRLVLALRSAGVSLWDCLTVWRADNAKNIDSQTSVLSETVDESRFAGAELMLLAPVAERWLKEPKEKDPDRLPLDGPRRPNIDDRPKPSEHPEPMPLHEPKGPDIDGRPRKFKDPERVPQDGPRRPDGDDRPKKSKDMESRWKRDWTL